MCWADTILHLANHLMETTPLRSNITRSMCMFSVVIRMILFVPIRILWANWDSILGGTWTVSSHESIFFIVVTVPPPPTLPPSLSHPPPPALSPSLFVCSMQATCAIRFLSPPKAAPHSMKSCCMTVAGYDEYSFRLSWFWSNSNTRDLQMLSLLALLLATGILLYAMRLSRGENASRVRIAWPIVVIMGIFVLWCFSILVSNYPVS